MKLHKKGLIIVISGPSGVGKGKIKRSLFQKKGHNFVYSISMTTRPPRRKEIDGIDYFFVNEEYFQKKIQENYFLEYNKFVYHYYGTPYKEVLDKLEQNKDIILEIDIKGASQLRKTKIANNIVFIFIAPPSIECLFKRLKKRNTENENMLNKRMEMAEKEMKLSYKYDYVVVNDILEEAIEKVISIIVAEHCKIRNNFYCCV